MSNYWNNSLMLPAPELRASVNGTMQTIGMLLYQPVKLILDNQSDDETALYMSTNGGATSILWHTFTPGQNIVLDADLFVFPLGTIFYGTGSSGNFSVSYTYAPQ